MRLFLTGATGYIGSALARRLVRDGHEVRALVRPTSRTAELEALGVARFLGDLGDRASMREGMSGADWVLHLGAELDLSAPPDRMATANVSGSENVASLAYKLGVPRFLAVSSIARWEGIVVDPIGAVLAVLVFEAISHGTGNALAETLGAVASNLFLTTLAGGVVGWVVARLLALLLERHTIPDHLQSPVALMAVMIAFVGANLLRHEAGAVIQLQHVGRASQHKLAFEHAHHERGLLAWCRLQGQGVARSEAADHQRLLRARSLLERGPAFAAEGPGEGRQR